MGYVASESCPGTWPALSSTPGAGLDGNASVLVGGDLTALGAAAGAEGVVVVRGRASFALDAPGTYRVGTVATGSQVTPYPDSDVLTVGGALGTGPGTRLDVGAGTGGDVVVGEVAASGVDAELNGGRLDAGFPSAVAPYEDLLGSLATRSAGFAGLAPTGSVELTDTAIRLVGDGTSETQVFVVDGASLGAVTPSVPDPDPQPDPEPEPGAGEWAEADGPVEADEPVTVDDTPPPAPQGRTLELVGVPVGATTVVNLTGPSVDLAVDGVPVLDGRSVDPGADPVFGSLATQLLWNAPSATSVAVSGTGQLPGSVLVPSAPSTTTLSGAGTNGRVLVAGDLVHAGSGALHSYPFRADEALDCGPALAHLGTLKVDVRVQDPDDVVRGTAQSFAGRFSCYLDGQDVTPAVDSWSVRAPAEARVVADDLPVGAVCTVTEKLDDPPRGEGWEWVAQLFEPAEVRVEKREPRTVTITNRARAVAVAPGTATPEPDPDPQPSPPPTGPPAPPEPTDLPDPVAPSEPTPSSLPDPTNRPTPTAPTATEPPAPSPGTDATDPSGSSGDGRRPQADAPLPTTAPFTLRGAFVWAPVLLLSVLTLLLRVRRRPKRLPV